MGNRLACGQSKPKPVATEPPAPKAIKKVSILQKEENPQPVEPIEDSVEQPNKISPEESHVDTKDQTVQIAPTAELAKTKEAHKFLEESKIIVSARLDDHHGECQICVDPKLTDVKFLHHKHLAEVQKEESLRTQSSHCVATMNAVYLRTNFSAKDAARRNRDIFHAKAQFADEQRSSVHPNAEGKWWPFCIRMQLACRTADAFHIVYPLPIGGDLSMALARRRNSFAKRGSPFYDSSRHLVEDDGTHAPSPLPTMAQVLDEEYSLTRRGLPLRFVVQAAYELLCALVAIDRDGCSHNDVKPRAVMLDRDGHVLLSDFGFSGRFEEPAPVNHLIIYDPLKVRAGNVDVYCYGKTLSYLLLGSYQMDETDTALLEQDFGLEQRAELSSLLSDLMDLIGACLASARDSSPLLSSGQLLEHEFFHNPVVKSCVGLSVGLSEREVWAAVSERELQTVHTLTPSKVLADGGFCSLYDLGRFLDAHGHPRRTDDTVFAQSLCDTQWAAACKFPRTFPLDLRYFFAKHWNFEGYTPEVNQRYLVGGSSMDPETVFRKIPSNKESGEGSTTNPKTTPASRWLTRPPLAQSLFVTPSHALKGGSNELTFTQKEIIRHYESSRKHERLYKLENPDTMGALRVPDPSGRPQLSVYLGE